MIRAGLISMIYENTLTLNTDSLTDSAAVTLMGTDVERVVANFRAIHEVWASILEVGLALWLLERQLWIASLIPLFISVGRFLIAENMVLLLDLRAKSLQGQL
jgi:ATP-binding cassette subfamily C (CFTR/MRP) protein 1